MNFVMAVALLWVGGAMLFLAYHGGSTAITPWGMYQDLLSRIRGAG